MFICLNNGYNKKYFKVEEENYFYIIMEVEDILNFKEMEFGIIYGKELNCELSELKEIEYV